MSATAILHGTLARLRDVLEDHQGKLSDVRSDGRPPPNAGQRFYAVHWGGGKSGDPNPLSHNVEQMVTVTITARMGQVPSDRVGARLLLATELIGLADVIAGPDVIHGNYAVLDAANALITGFGVTTNGFIEPFVLLDYGPVREQSPEWVGADAKNGAMVLTCDVRFGTARRVQLL